MAYLRREPVVLMLMILGVVPFILGNPYQSMLPVFAKEERAGEKDHRGTRKSGPPGGRFSRRLRLRGVVPSGVGWPLMFAAARSRPSHMFG